MTTRMMGSSRAYDVVQYDGIRRPQYLDIHGAEALEVKNGLTTGTIVGRATGLDSFTRTHTNTTSSTRPSVAILRYDKQRGPFSLPSRGTPAPSTGLAASSTCSLAVVARPRRQPEICDTVLVARQGDQESLPRQLVSLRRCRPGRELDSTRNGLINGTFPLTSSLFSTPLVSCRHARSSPFASPSVSVPRQSVFSLPMPTRWIAVLVRLFLFYLSFAHD